MLARTPWTPLPKVAPKQKRLSKARKQAIRDQVVAMMRTAEPTVFAAEAPCRHGIRSSLCEQGWGWELADTTAKEIVTAALNIVGAKRPTWKQGQPEYTQEGHVPLERTRCVRCGGNPLPEGHHKYCSSLCAKAAKAARRYQMEPAEARARQTAYYAAWSIKQPKQPCEGCGAMFRPSRPGRRFCGRTCSNRANATLSTW